VTQKHDPNDESHFTSPKLQSVVSEMSSQEPTEQTTTKDASLINPTIMKYLPYVTLAMIVLFVYNLFYDIHTSGIMLILLAFVPWLLPYINKLSLPGGVSLELIMWKRIDDHQQRIQEHSKEIEAQREEYDRLALTIYSLGENTYRHLRNMVNDAKTGGEYIFHNNDTMSHDFRFLIDSGYVKWFDFNQRNNQDIAKADLVTPAGNILVELREKYAEKSKLMNLTPIMASTPPRSG
jgi:hypothetical protein